MRCASRMDRRPVVYLGAQADNVLQAVLHDCGRGFATEIVCFCDARESERGSGHGDSCGLLVVRSGQFVCVCVCGLFCG